MAKTPPIIVMGTTKRAIKEGEIITINIKGQDVSSPDIELSEEGKKMFLPATWRPEHERSE